MKKSTSIFLGLVLMAIALCLFCTNSVICAVIGASALFFAVVFLNYADHCQSTQDEKRHRSNGNLNTNTGECNPPSHR